MGRYGIAMLLIGAVIAAGCGAGSSAAEDTGTEAEAVAPAADAASPARATEVTADPPAPSPSPTPVASPSPTPTPDAPELDLTLADGDYERLVTQVFDFWEWLLQHPDQQQHLTKIYYPACECYEGLQGVMASLVEKEVRLQSVELTVNDVVLLREEEGLASDSVLLEVTDTLGEMVFENEHGEVVERSDQSERDTSRWYLITDSQNRYRVAGYYPQ